jgi:predicted transglutaminase-like cysteine proteinase
MPTPAGASAPDIFGSVALRVSSTPFDWRWQAVSHQNISAASSQWARQLSKLPESERLIAVNRYVNGRIVFADDRLQFGSEDVWQPARATLERGRGDCEDYAILKLHLLRAAGIPESRLYLVIARDLTQRSDHAVLAVQSGDGLWIMDNRTDEVLSASKAPDYRPIFSYSAGKSWIYGYRRKEKAGAVALAHFVGSTTGQVSPSSGASLLSTAQ